MRKVVLGLLCVAFATAFLTEPLNAQSHNVAFVGGPTIMNGGTLPTASTYPADFSGFTFSNITRTDLQNLTTLNLYDTIVLNVASYYSSGGLNCNLNAYLTSTARTTLVTWVGNGGKLIIYDSECSSQDYSWLPYPFTTYNPGATGSFSGSVHVVEDSQLSTKVGNPTCTGLSGWLATKCINVTAITANTDAVGDMNVMTTYDANWCLDMSGTNVYNRTGPVHTYAKYPAGSDKGLIIYNGFDQDYDNYTTAGAAQLRKVFLQELQVPFNPSGSALPCGVVVAGIKLAPTTSLKQVNTPVTETAILTDLVNAPVPNKVVTFAVTGANPTGTPQPTGTTDANGKATLNYTGTALGWDTIVASFVGANNTTIFSTPAKVQWINCDFNGDLVVNGLDIAAVKAQVGNSSTVMPAMDNDGDSWITSSDVRRCMLVCTNRLCQ